MFNNFQNMDAVIVIKNLISCKIHEHAEKKCYIFDLRLKNTMSGIVI